MRSTQLVARLQLLVLSGQSAGFDVFCAALPGRADHIHPPSERHEYCAIGERIRFIRNLRGMTQKFLGSQVGFTKRTADIRMAQYESGSRIPKADLIEQLANALDVSTEALNVPNIDSSIRG